MKTLRRAVLTIIHKIMIMYIRFKFVGGSTHWSTSWPSLSASRISPASWTESVRSRSAPPSTTTTTTVQNIQERAIRNVTWTSRRISARIFAKQSGREWQLRLRRRIAREELQREVRHSSGGAETRTSVSRIPASPEGLPDEAFGRFPGCHRLELRREDRAKKDELNETRLLGSLTRTRSMPKRF